MRATGKLHKLALVAAVFAGLTFAPANVFATPIFFSDSGNLDISNALGVLVGITSSPNSCISFSGSGICSTTVKAMSVSGISSIFAVGSGTIGDILNGVSQTTPFETVPGTGANTINFNLTSLVTSLSGMGNCTSNAVGNTCTPAGSPFTFSENATGVTISFSVLLAAYIGASGSGTTSYQGIFSAQESGVLNGSGACSGATASITSILTCEAAGGTMTTTWSATESPLAATPLPAALPLFGTGLGALGLLGWRRKQKAQAVAA